VKINVPEAWADKERVQLEFDPGFVDVYPGTAELVAENYDRCEAMIWTNNGVPLQGITGGHGGDRRVEHILPDKARKSSTYEVRVSLKLCPHPSPC
jgi:alpha-mannosidase